MKCENQAILARLARTEIFQTYQRAFGQATGLPLTLSPADDWHAPLHDRPYENPFCALLSRQSAACAACLRSQEILKLTAQTSASTVRCFAGLTETAIPLRVGQRLIGFLRTGEVLPRRPSNRDFADVIKKLRSLGIPFDETTLRAAYFESAVVPAERYESVLQLLQVFAQHLMLVADQVVLQTENAEPPAVTRAREFIDANYTEDISLSAVARAAHMSTFYFCKQFKKATGLSFTEYLARVRVERAKEQLLKPHARVSEVAFEVGFQSLTHFNRVFKKLSGESPSLFRSHPLAEAA